MLTRAGQVLARAANRLPNVPLGARRTPLAPRRSMGAHARDIGLPGGEHVPIKVAKVHERLGTIYMTTMFLWMMYRFKEDGKVLLGLEHPWDHMHEHEEEPILYRFTDAGDDDEEDEDDDDE